MLVIQHNCRQRYKNIVIVLETPISIKVGIVMVQKLCIGSWEICHSRFNFYWPPKEKKEIWVMTAVRKNLGDKIMVDYRTDFIHYPYFMLFEICKLNP